jgi:uncharacterized protein (DUF305 family)
MNGTMEREKSQYRWIYWLAWAALLALASATVARGAAPPPLRNVQRSKSSGDRDRRNEINFMQRMMDLEAAAVQLAQVGQGRTSHRELRDLLDRVGSSGQNRVDQLGSWLRQWYGIRYTPQIDPKYAAQISVLSQRGIRGDEFEIRMLKTMADHQSEVAALIARNQSNVTQEDLRQILRPTMDNRNARARQCRNWLRSWYNISYKSR